MKVLPIGIENFKEIIDKNAYYIDKSELINEIINEKVILLTRPRRFGKTLNMSMIYYFFSNKEKDNAYLFENLHISRYPDVMKHQNQYPVIYITLKNMNNKEFNSQLYTFGSIIATILDKYEDIISDKIFNDRQKTLLNKYHNGKATPNELKE